MKRICPRCDGLSDRVNDNPLGHELYVVICTTSTIEGGRGGYELATSRFFFVLSDAQAYRSTISPSRTPLIALVVNPEALDRPLCNGCGALLSRDGTCTRSCVDLGREGP